jgi:hypothetical protein
MTAPVVTQPDLEAWVWANVKTVPGVTSFCYAVVNEWPFWNVAYSVQIDARATTKQAARDAAEQVRQIVVGLPDVPWPDGWVSYVQPVDGPFWLPDPDGGPRYVARYEIRAHPPS